MSTKHAVLGLLLDRPAYAYQLADRFPGRLGPAWEMNSGQLSQTIKLLEQDGLIQRVEDDTKDVGGRRPAESTRQVYAITQLGEDEFERWFGGATMLIPLSRRPLVVKLTLAGPDRLTGMLEQIDANERSCASRVGELARLREACNVEGPQVRADEFLLRLNLDLDIVLLEGGLRWLRHAREMVSSLLTRDVIWPSARERSIGHARDGARDELFDRLAARHLRSISEEQGNDR